MKSTQKKPNNTDNKKNDWQIPERSQVYLTPGAQKSLEEAQKKGEQVIIKTDRAPVRKKQSPPPAIAKADSANGKNSEQTNSKVPVKQPQKTKAPETPLTLKEAIFAEIRDRARTVRMSIQVNSEDIIRGVLCGTLMMLFALLQTTFFVRFAPFGSVPDMMLVFVLAIGVYEGEKWGSITGIVAAFVISALGSSGKGPDLLPVIYLAAGCTAGLLSKYYLRHTPPVNGLYVLAASLIKAVSTVITASIMLDATLGDIILRIAVPEYFSTVIVSPLPFLTVWLCFRRFHKTRAERTDSRGE